MKILLALSLCCVSAVVAAASAASAAAVEVSGCVGAEVSIRCSGNWTTPGNSSERHKLYFCRGACTERNVIILSAGGEAGVTRRGRYSIEAGGGDGAFKVTIAELKKTDAGTYQCGVGKSMVALYQEVSLIILDASTVPGSPPPHAATTQAAAGRLPRSSQPTTTSPSRLSPPTSQEDTSPPAAGKLKETTVVIIVSVSLALVVCAVIPLIFYGHCRSGSAQSKVGTNNPEAGRREHNADFASAAAAPRSEDTKEPMSQPAAQYVAVYQALDPRSLD